MKKDAKENGITLVALVVTIIVLLILAGVSLSLVLGDNGIITRAQDAVTKYKEAEAEEQWQMVALNQEGQNLAWALQEQGYSVSELGEGYLVADVEQKNLYYFLPHDLDYLVVPSKIDGVVVREVKGFSYLENVDTVILPNTVEVIRW